MSVSGIAVVNQRSNSVRAIEQLTERATVMSRPLQLPPSDALPPQLQQPIDDYLDESGAASALLLPLHASDQTEDEDGIDPFDDSGRLIGVMLLERFSGQAFQGVDERCRQVAGEATLSLRNSAGTQSSFWSQALESVGGLTASHRLTLISALAFATFLLIASMLLQVEHYVVATGSVEPTSRREIYASVDGVVKQLHVRDGQSVKAGQLLMELENAELENRPKNWRATSKRRPNGWPPSRRCESIATPNRDNRGDWLLNNISSKAKLPTCERSRRSFASSSKN